MCPQVRFAHFNPRSPCGERLDSKRVQIKYAEISIHAPRVGSDYKANKLIPNVRAFQSTLPVWGATDELDQTYHL